MRRLSAPSINYFSQLCSLPNTRTAHHPATFKHLKGQLGPPVSIEKVSVRKSALSQQGQLGALCEQRKSVCDEKPQNVPAQTESWPEDPILSLLGIGRLWPSTLKMLYCLMQDFTGEHNNRARTYLFVICRAIPYFISCPSALSARKKFLASFEIIH